MEIVSIKKGKRNPWVRLLGIFQAVSTVLSIMYFYLFLKSKQPVLIPNGNLTNNTDLYLAIWFFIAALAFYLILKFRQKARLVWVRGSQVKKANNLEIENGNELSEALRKKVKELFKQYDTRDINDPRIQEGLKTFANTLDVKIK